MTKLSHEISNDQLDAGIGLEVLSDTDLIEVLKARLICYEAELLSLANKRAFIEELRDANAALLAKHVGVEVPGVELRGAGTMYEVFGVSVAEQIIQDGERLRADNLRIAIERHGANGLRRNPCRRMRR